MAYQLTSGSTIQRISDGAFVPVDLANRDYQEYLQWAAAGNTAEPAPVISPPTTISAAAFLARFLPAEEVAIQTAAATNPQIALGLTMGIAKGQIDLVSPTVTTWMNALVTANCITSARMTAILTP